MFERHQHVLLGIVKAHSLRLARESGTMICRYTLYDIYIERLRGYIGVDYVMPVPDILECVADEERSRYAISDRIGTVSIKSS